MPIIIVVLCTILVAELASSRAFPASVNTLQSDLPSGSDDLHSVQVAANRLRRKVGGYDGPGPVEYMEIIRERLESHEETDATAVWGILDTGRLLASRNGCSHTLPETIINFQNNNLIITVMNLRFSIIEM